MEALIAHEAYTAIKPWTNPTLTDTNAGQVLAEAREVAKQIPPEITIGWSE
jgi:hypothetical protein